MPSLAESAATFYKYSWNLRRELLDPASVVGLLGEGEAAPLGRRLADRYEPEGGT